MKNFLTALTWLLICAPAWAESYWIQVLSVDANTTVDKQFLQRLEAAQYPYETVTEKGKLKVCIGGFDSEVAALKTLSDVRCKIASDAFIVKGHASALAVKVESVPAALAVIQEGKKEPEVAKTADQAKTEVSAAAVSEQPAAQPCVCICDKHALRKAEITNALSYYKNSSHYRFGKNEKSWFE
jgi:hypothetical protein